MTPQRVSDERLAEAISLYTEPINPSLGHDLAWDLIDCRAALAEAEKLVAELAAKLEERSFDGGYDVQENCCECNRKSDEGHEKDCAVKLLLEKASQRGDAHEQ